MSDIQANDFIVGGRTRSAVLDVFLKEQESRNANQQNSDRNSDEAVDAIAINISQVNQETHAQIGPRSAARRPAPERLCGAPCLFAGEQCWRQFW